MDEQHHPHLENVGERPEHFATARAPASPASPASARDRTTNGTARLPMTSPRLPRRLLGPAADGALALFLGVASGFLCVEWQARSFGRSMLLRRGHCAARGI
jgi:hypothetical protein